MKGLAFLVFLIIVFVLIYAIFILEPLVLGSMKYYQFIIGGFLAFLPHKSRCNKKNVYGKETGTKKRRPC